jgi:hypothetical protein
MRERFSYLALITSLCEGTSGILQKTLTLKHSFQPVAVESLILTTGSRVPAFKTIESRRPNLLRVSEMADLAVPSCVMSHWMKCRDGDGRGVSSAEVFRDNTTTLAEYLVTNAFTIPRPSY